MIRVGVIGVGTMGQHHARIYSKMDNCELVGVADINVARAKEIARKYKTNFYEDYRELLKKNLDAVSIAVPTTLHKKIALEVIERGIHLLIEKPIASSLEEADAIIEKAKKNKVKLLIGHIERFNPAIQKLKEVLDKGILGNLLIISTRRVGPFVTRIRDVGIIIDSATHDIDVVRYLVNREPKNVFAKLGRIKHKKEDHALILLDFSDIAASIEVNWFTPHKVRTLVATGVKGIAYLDYIHQELEIYTQEGRFIPNIIKEEPLKLEIEHFVECVEGDKQPLVSGEDGRKVLEIALKAMKIGGKSDEK